MAGGAGHAATLGHTFEAMQRETFERGSPKSRQGSRNDSTITSDLQDDAIEQTGNGTPSTASRIKPAPVENAFPTPPRRIASRASNSQGNGRQSPDPVRIYVGKSSPAPKEHKSVEALRSDVSRADFTGLSSANELEKSWQRRELSKKNSAFFDQAFAVREPYNSAKERVTRDSMIVVEVQLNCCLETEQSFLNDLLTTVAEIYHKPHNNVMITTTTDAHIMISGSMEPAYLLSITALPSEIASMKNLRTTMMVQDFLNDSLKIPTSRGVVKFHSIREEDFGNNGTTARAEIETIEAEEKRLGCLRSRQSNRASKKSTLPSMSETFGNTEHSRSDTPILANNHDGVFDDDKEVRPHRSASSAGRIMKGKKSIMTFWKRS